MRLGQSIRRGTDFGLRLCFALGLLLVTPSLRLFAQPAGTTGSVAGTVLDGTTGKYLEGAEVLLQGTAFETATSRDGSFNLTNVPPGAYKVIVNYPGSATATDNVTVTAGQVARLSIKLNAEILTMTEFKVTGTKE